MLKTSLIFNHLRSCFFLGDDFSHTDNANKIDAGF
jgi:hypothetical protein